MEKILVVEDDATIVRGIVFALEKEGWQVYSAGTLKEGYELLKSGDFDLLLLDVLLPDGDGFEMCGNIRKSSMIPIIFLTACNEEVNVVMGLETGGDDYMTKPFRVRELISRIKAILRRTSVPIERKTPDKCIKSDDISLYPFDKRVLKNNSEIPLSPSEYRMVEYFMLNPNQVLTRDQILERLWDSSCRFIDDNTLSVYIRRVREKIEDDSSLPTYIATVKGYGYKWNKPVGE